MEDRDFIDFKFGDHWASEFNLIAVSSGDRYSPPVYGSVNPNTTTVAGKVGVYKWKSQIGEKVFNINIAFDNINGQTLNQIKEWLHPFKIDKLTFKEEPFKYYWVTLNSEPELNFVPFLEETKVVNGIEFKQGIYKGEFNIQFVCFDNYGYSDWQSFDENYDYLAEVVNSTNGVISVNDAMNVETEIGIQGVSRQETRAAEEGETVEGEMISLNDVDATKEHEFIIEGNSSQETRKGYNKLQLPNQTFSSNGITLEIKDGIMTFNGTNNGTESVFNLTSNEFTTTSTTKLKAFQLGGSCSDTYQPNIYTYVNWANIVATGIISSAIVSYAPNLTYTRVVVGIKGGTFTNYKVGILVADGITDTTEFEPYGIMPSLEFESPVEGVGSNINEFDKDNANVLNGSIDISSKTFKEASIQKSIYIECKPNTTYTISKIISKRFIIGTSENVPSQDSVFTNCISNADVDELSITSSENDKYLCVYYYTQQYDTLTEQEILDSIKIEKGTKATSWSPYGQGSIEVEVCNKNLADLTVFTLKGSAARYLNRAINSFDMISTGTWGNCASIFENIYPNEDLTISSKFLETVAATSKVGISVYGNDEENTSSMIEISSSIVDITKNNQRELSLSFNTSNYKYIILRFWSNCTGTAETEGNSYVEVTDVQLERKTKTDYEPHQLQTYPIYLDRELYDNEIIKDAIVKRNNKWYYKLNWYKYIFTGNENFANTYGTNLFSVGNLLNDNPFKAECKAYSNYFTYNPVQSGINNILTNYEFALQKYGTGNNVFFKCENYDNPDNFKAKLIELYNIGNPMYIIYPLEKPFYQEITDEILIAQLDALENSTLYQNITNIIGNDNVKLHYNYLTPIPSIKIPSEIQNTEEKVDIQICNKNLIPFGYDKGHTISAYGITIEILDEHRIKINGTATNNFSYDLLGNNDIYYKKDNFYTLSCKKVSGSFSDYLLVHTSFKNDTVDNWSLQSVNLKNEELSTTIKITEDGYSPRLIIYALAGFSFDNLIIEIQLEQGKTATEYVDHQSQTVTFPLSEGQKLYEGSYLAEDGIHNTRRQYIFTGEEYITTIDSGTRLCTSSKRVAALNEIKINMLDYTGNLSNVLSNCFETTTQNQVVNSDNYMAFSQWGEDKYIYFSAANRTIEGLQALFKERYENGTPIMIEYELEKEEVIPYTQEQEEALKNIYLYTGINNIYVDNAELALTYIPQQNIYIDYMVNCSNLLNDSSFYHDNDIYKKSYFDIDTGDATKSGISTNRPVYLYNAGTSRANLNLIFDLIIPTENSPLIIKTESCKLTDNGIQILNEESLISISNFANFKPFLDIYDGNLDNWQIEIDSELCEIYVKHKIDKTKIISLNKFNDEQSFLSLANCKFVDYLKPFPTSITAISNSAIENTIFNKLSVASSAQNYRLKNVYVDWKHTYI